MCLCDCKCMCVCACVHVCALKNAARASFHSSRHHTLPQCHGLAHRPRDHPVEGKLDVSASRRDPAQLLWGLGTDGGQQMGQCSGHGSSPSFTPGDVHREWGTVAALLCNFLVAWLCGLWLMVLWLCGCVLFRQCGHGIGDCAAQWLRAGPK